MYTRIPCGKVRYVRSNPVRTGLADREHDYRWSSALFWEEGLGSDELGLRIDDAMIERFAPLDSLVLRRGKRPGGDPQPREG